MRIDVYHSKAAYARWQKRTLQGIPGLSPENNALVRRFLDDMERGMNIAPGSRKGGRTPYRLTTLRTKLVWVARQLQERFALASMVLVTEEQLHTLFGAMRSGELRTRAGGAYRSTWDYVKVFKTFWHWHVRVERKQGRQVVDVCVDLDDSRTKPPWVYLTAADVDALCRHAKFPYRALILFLYDSGIRSPTELVNVRAADLSADCTTLKISDEASKTFGRTINLLLSPPILREYLAERRLAPTDPVFPICPSVTNRYLQRLATRVLGTAQTAAGAPYGALTMYDFRHASACYWLPRYKSELALKYRFGWKKGEMIHYYTELLGMHDTITTDDLHLGNEKTQIEQRLAQTEAAKRLVEEEMHTLRQEMQTILESVAALARRVP